MKILLAGICVCTAVTLSCVHVCGCCRLCVCGCEFLRKIGEICWGLDAEKVGIMRGKGKHRQKLSFPRMAEEAASDGRIAGWCRHSFTCEPRAEDVSVPVGLAGVEADSRSKEEPHLALLAHDRCHDCRLLHFCSCKADVPPHY